MSTISAEGVDSVLGNVKGAVLALFSALVLLQFGCQQESPAQESPTPLGANQNVVRPLDVVAIAAPRAEIFEPISVTGAVLAYKTTDLVPMVGGMVEEIFVGVGDRVEKGQPLLRMRQRDFEIRVERLRQAVRLASAEQHNARVDLESASALVSRSALSKEELDDRKTRYEATTAQLGIAQADLAEAELAMADATTRAPYDGVITQRDVDEGAFVSSFMRSSEPVMQIQMIDIMVAVVFVPEVHLQSIKLGTPGKVSIASLNKTYETEVHLINDRIDPTTRSIDVRLGIENPDHEIKPGLFIEVDLYPEPRTAAVVPLEVVRGLGGDRYVFVAENGFARRRQIQIRELEDGRAEIVSGLDSAELIIRGPDLRLLQDNVQVTVRAPS